jgi:hypothetical protein
MNHYGSAALLFFLVAVLNTQVARLETHPICVVLLLLPLAKVPLEGAAVPCLCFILAATALLRF